jgi:hypothetical protein
MKNDLIISEDKIFRIEGVIPKNPTSYIAIGDDNNNLEITFDSSTLKIASIESSYVDNILNENLYLPSYKEDKRISRCVAPTFSYDEEFPPTYVLNYNREELDILINDNLEPSYYYLDGRVEYYYDDEFNLTFVRVNSLKEEEYDFFEKIYSSKKRIG